MSPLHAAACPSSLLSSLRLCAGSMPLFTSPLLGRPGELSQAPHRRTWPMELLISHLGPGQAFFCSLGSLEESAVPFSLCALMQAAELKDVAPAHGFLCSIDIDQPFIASMERPAASIWFPLCTDDG
ncbi:hypothetical protein PYCCODRAFT_1430248 [Trametes coccinea BRFM310]|uniref:Uncharacterized protein n=1 Tax=Trametes coccinea (strain BRFM310) TaxID=1353009 RepID=A0A1Y2J3S5_TRAC3|nr:hypothetical protein PYCCODRAFT_1430248 [Trametes coccinea BRFM310]